MPASGPLASVSVLECGDGAAAALCGLLLGQLGARVVKLAIADRVCAEPWEALRAGARRLYLDGGKEIVDTAPESDAFDALLDGADVVVHGVERAGRVTAARLQTRLRLWRARRPELICAALTPFGLDGPLSGWLGEDLSAQALSGWSAVGGNPGEPPLAVGYDVGALQHGLAAAGAIAAALVERPSGGGDLIDVSEAEVLGADIRMYSGSYRGYGIAMVRSGHRAPGSSGRYPHTVLPCKDGLVVLICRSDGEWDRFVTMMGRPRWADEPRYRDFYAMATEYPDEVDALLIEWLRERTKAELSVLATRHRVPLAPVRTTEETMADTQLAHRGFFAAGGGKLPGLPARWAETGS